MRLKSVRIRNFRNIVDSGEVEIDGTVTCLVGKNESGKTAFLQALHRLSPARGGATFSVPDHYPAWLEKSHRLRGTDLTAEKPVSATFALEDHELVALESQFGEGCVRNPSCFVMSRKYDNNLSVGLRVSEEAFIQHVIKSNEWPRGTKMAARKAKSIDELLAYVDERSNSADDSGRPEAMQQIRRDVKQRLGAADGLWQAVWERASDYFPRFLYFADYSRLPYSVEIQRVLRADQGDLTESELTARSLLRLVAAEDDYLQHPDYERRKRELENVSNAITLDVLKYWSQNPELRVQPDITQRTETDRQGQHAVLDELKIRVWDNRHLLSLPFSEHSTGFQWFFSFLAAFSEFEDSSESVVLLLDEPALGLHARAQADFLRFIDERLAPNRQVIYTTHSPFMVQPGQLERVRLVEDKGRDLGAVVSSDVGSTDADTLFPLQGALGYDLAQHLFIAPHNLVVEGTSDFTYLRAISDYLRDQGRSSLDDRWSVVPVGGADLVPTFVALLGHHLDVTVVVDAKKGGNQRLTRMATTGLLGANRLVTIGDIIGESQADIEDLFTESDYLRIFNGGMNQSMTSANLVGDGPIVGRLARAMSVARYDHGRPADFFLRNRDTVLAELADETLERFERLFKRVNATLSA